MAETSRKENASHKENVGVVVVIGAGVAGIRAAIDLAAVGYQVLLTDDSAQRRDLLGRLSAVAPEDRCELCDLSLPEEEHHLAAFFCMRRNLLHYETLTFIGEVASTKAADQGRFEVSVSSSDGSQSLQVDALVVAGNTLDDEGARNRLEQLREVLGVQGVFGCGAANGATEVEAALISASAAAGECSRYLKARGRRPAMAVPRVEHQSAEIEEHRIPVVQQAVVIGGGLGGLLAAHSLASRGIEVQLIVAPDGELGSGPDLEPTLVEEVTNDRFVTIHRPIEILQNSGTVGRFLTVIRCDGADDILLPHGATIITASALRGWGAEGTDGERLAKCFGIELNADGSLQSATKWKPVDSVKRGVYLIAGGSRGEVVARAEAAAQRAYRYLRQEEIEVPRVVSRISAEICSKCEACLYLCPYEARTKNDADVIVVQEKVCEGCGVCAANCPSDATEMQGVLDEETRLLIESTIDSASKILP